MAKGLIIVESPAKANTISKFLNHEFSVKASMGHIRDLPTHDLGVKIDKDFEPVYVVDPKKKKIISELKEIVSKVDSVYLASDHDREGEAIAWHLSKVLEKDLSGKKIYRIIFNEVTAPAIKEAISHPDNVDQNKVDAQQARRVLDRIVGYQISPLLWKIIAKDLSAGRVQSVALRLICEREAEILDFVPKEYWKIEVDIWKGTLAPFKASLEKYQGKKIELNDEPAAMRIVEEIKEKQAILSELKKTTRNVEPPPPFITSTLQQEASKILNFQAQRTMSIAQQLYEGIQIGSEHTGLITYMRTDSVRISSEANEECRKLVTERYGKDKLHAQTRSYKNKSSAQDAHEAIRPTSVFHTPETMETYLSKEQLKLYTLIWQRFVATQMIPVKLINTQAGITLGEAVFSASGNEISEPGFLKAYPHVNFIMGEQIHSGYAKQDELEHGDLLSSQHFTSPPSRFTEASLIKELEAKGIGRPSTYATIITTLRQRKYVQMDKKSFVPTSLGTDVNTFLISKFESIFNVRFTAEMEDKLDGIEEGNTLWQNLVRDYYTQLQKLIGSVDIKAEKQSFVEETDLVCDRCHEGKMLIKRNKNGEFLACSKFPKCRNSKSFKRAEDGSIKILEPATLEEKCPKCGEPLVKRSGKFGEFIACSTYPKCKYSRAVSLGFKCPKCKVGEIVQRKNKKGRIFYACSTYPTCDWITNDKPVDIPCPKCGHSYMFELTGKAQGMKCPNCNALVN
ncbi:MAG: type I DNA topoisomerase [Candidatus Cloacimonetes bacterium]|nr:type I DNA topoisomerase [Candidatus Cloacimonadota bacterium]